jgi:outer membrane immunogenic protein
MRIRIKDQIILLLVAMAVSTLTATASAHAAIAADKQLRAEIAISYNFVRSGGPPGFDGDFNLNGGSATFACPLGHRHFALVGDISGTHVDSISGNQYDLTPISHTAGVRYSPGLGHSALHPYAQVLAGGAHSSRSLVEGPESNTTNASAAFTANAGGSLDLGMSRHISPRLVEADYFFTTFDNLVSNLRIGTGVVFRFQSSAKVSKAEMG